MKNLKIYGRHTCCTLNELENLETPEGLSWWFAKEKVNDDRTMDSDELFFSSEQLTKEFELENNLKYLGENEFELFYMTEKINGAYYTYVTDDPNGPGDLLYPVTWSQAKVYFAKSRRKNEFFLISQGDNNLWSSMPAYILANEFLGLLTKDVALKYGIGINDPINDPTYSEITKKYFEELAKMVEEPDDEDNEKMAAGL